MVYLSSTVMTLDHHQNMLVSCSPRTPWATSHVLRSHAFPCSIIPSTLTQTSWTKMCISSLMTSNDQEIMHYITITILYKCALLVGGLNPSETYESVGIINPNIWKVNFFPNHQTYFFWPDLPAIQIQVTHTWFLFSVVASVLTRF